MAMFMENYRKQQQAITDDTKYSNFFAEAYQVSEDIDLQIMMSEMTVELRDILYSETDISDAEVVDNPDKKGETDNKSRIKPEDISDAEIVEDKKDEGSKGETSSGKETFGAKVKKFIRKVIDFIKRMIRFIVAKIKGDESAKYKNVIEKVEKILTLITTADINDAAMSKLLIPVNKISTLLKFLMHDIISRDKYIKLHDMLRHGGMKSELASVKRNKEYLDITGKSHKSDIYRVKYILEKSDKISNLINDFKKDNSSVYLKMMVLQTTEYGINCIIQVKTSEFNSEYDNAMRLFEKNLKDKNLDSAINSINNILLPFEVQNSDNRLTIHRSSQYYSGNTSILNDVRERVVSMLGIDIESRKTNSSTVNNIDAIMDYIDKNVDINMSEDIIMPNLLV